MTDQELIEQLRFEYYAELMGTVQYDETHHANTAAHFVAFYDFLLKRGFSRQKLAVLGISREDAG